MPRLKVSAKRLSGWFTLARPCLFYGAILAAGALALTWLDYLRFARTFPGEFQLFFIAAGFLGLGVWAGARMFAGRREAPAFDGNRDAQRTLRLSAREMDVIALIADGLSNKEIAARLNVSANTVKLHVARMLEKLEVSRRTAALARARQLGLLP
ncbi:MAG: LuxR C-terminal-related transcriptional regulator [Hyphomonas sp.]|uniref:helix-turn-helix transcriptional regulator n=1 Tax=Hyphomonas sp. TaxID=87 RepID=UPI0034A033EC